MNETNSTEQEDRITCPQCDHAPCETHRTEVPLMLRDDTLGDDKRVELREMQTHRRCGSCEFEWQDWEAELEKTDMACRYWMKRARELYQDERRQRGEMNESGSIEDETRADEALEDLQHTALQLDDALDLVEKYKLALEQIVELSADRERFVLMGARAFVEAERIVKEALETKWNELPRIEEPNVVSFEGASARPVSEVLRMLLDNNTARVASGTDERHSLLNFRNAVEHITNKLESK